MKFFEWASFLLASVVSGGDVPALFDSPEMLSTPKVVMEKQVNLFTEKKSVIPSSKTSDRTSALKKDTLPQKKSIFEPDSQPIESAMQTSKPLESGVTLHVPEGSSLVVEEEVEIRVGDKFAAVIVDPVSGEIFSQSEWVEVKK